MTDSSTFVPDLIRWEGSVAHMYRDSLGYVTVGVGNLIPSGLDAAALPFLVDGTRPATHKEIGDDFLRVIALAKGMAASQYRAPHPPRIELPESTIQKLLRDRLDHEFIPGIRRLLPTFDSLPVPAQSALVDIAFNCGMHGLAQFSHLLDACGKRQWLAASRSCHRKTSREERNQWTADKFTEAS